MPFIGHCLLKEVCNIVFVNNKYIVGFNEKISNGTLPKCNNKKNLPKKVTPNPIF